MRVTSLDEERWILVSEDTFNAIRFGVGLRVDVVENAIHSMPDEMHVDPRIHEHLNDGGIVVIHCA